MIQAMDERTGDEREASLEMLLKYDGVAPRYTSCPPANFFIQDPVAADYEDLLHSSNHTGSRNISLYIHVPFIGDGLVSDENGIVQITEKGPPLTRMVAAAFDPLLRHEIDQPRYSRAI